MKWFIPVDKARFISVIRLPLRAGPSGGQPTRAISQKGPPAGHNTGAGMAQTLPYQRAQYILFKVAWDSNPSSTSSGPFLFDIFAYRLPRSDNPDSSIGLNGRSKSGRCPSTERTKASHAFNQSTLPCNSISNTIANSDGRFETLRLS